MSGKFTVYGRHRLNNEFVYWIRINSNNSKEYSTIVVYNSLSYSICKDGKYDNIPHTHINLNINLYTPLSYIEVERLYNIMINLKDLKYKKTFYEGLNDIKLILLTWDD